jgi:isopentenyl diphosphate isomerase/L-lactate dehydrogenase-like FMN-dependent dehydrogenase
MRGQWNRNLVIKDILRPEDMRVVEALGADGSVVFNRSGRQLDGPVAPIDALPAIVRRPTSGVTVMIDSGFRWGPMC